MAETPSLIVTTSADIVADDGETSLREAIAFANSNADASTITFAAGLLGQQITLAGSELVLSSEVTIDGDINGDDVADITVSGDDASRVFNVASGATTLDALTITNGYASAGGGILVFSGASLDLANSTVSGNAAGYGGGLYNYGTTTLNNSTISGNSANNGGGLYNSGTTTLTNSTISDNSANNGGGGLRNLGTATLTNSTISGNSAELDGGGIFNVGTATLNNSTISGNYADNGGGLYNYGTSTATLTNSIILGNSIAPPINEALSITGTPVITEAPSYAEVYGSVTSITSLTSGVVSEVFAALDSLGGGLLADNGGPVQTIALKVDVLNPTIDAGTDASAPSTDARGLGRIDVPGLANNGSNVSDLGAVEAFGFETPSLIVTTSADIVAADDGETSLREAIAFANSNADASTITFAAGLLGQQITLAGSELVLSSEVTIDGDVDDDDVADITVSGDNASRVFNVAGGAATLDALTITNGYASAGGGVFVESGATLDLTNSTISGSRAYEYYEGSGGGLYNSGTSTLTNSTISDNYAYESGGGLHNSGTGTVTLANSTISGNNATFGGGFYNSSTANLTNSTISGNYVSGTGGGIETTGGTVTLTNSIILGNSIAPSLNQAPSGAPLISEATSIADVNGLVTSITSLTSGVASDVFAALDSLGGGLLADNGGPVQTIALKADVLNPAIDAGTDASAPSTDARGAVRFDVPGIANNGSNVSDLGAVEAFGFETPSLIVTTSADIVADDGETSLREAIAFANSNADASTITFAAGLLGQQITLAGSELVLSSEVTIDGDINGDDVADITVSGDNASRVFNVASGGTTLDALTITNGYARAGGGLFGAGGGIYVYSGATLDLTNSLISGNAARHGGGLSNYGTATLTNSTISGNYATSFGGGLDNEGAATLTNSTISGNSALRGGGLSNFGTATLTNSTISGNSATRYGGGLYNEDTVTLTNSTISGNSALRDGGGLFTYGVATVNLTNSIVLGNDANVDAEVSRTPYSSVTNISSLTSGVASDVFAALDSLGGGLLADNGGPVQTIALKADVLNPAIDAGTDASAPSTDATGTARLDVTGIANNGSNVSDLGAVETLGVEAASLIVTTALDFVDAFDGETSLREAIAFANSNADASTITFAAGLLGQQITLAGSELVLSSEVTIDGDINGDDVADITVSGDNASRVFTVVSGAATLDALTITDGNAIVAGGVLVDTGATLEMVNSTISGNSSGYGGGLYNYGTATLTNSTISGNSSGYGGGLSNYGTATLANSTISGNAANFGGGLYNFGTATLTNSTISGNYVSGTGGGIGTISGTVTLTNSIVLGNNAPSDAEVAGSVTSNTSLTSGAASDVFAALDSSGGGLLADNGGPVQTIALKADALNPAIDAGTDASAPLTDARGLSRIDLNFINNSGTADLGAFEIQDQFLFAPTITSGTALSAAENQTGAGVVVASDDKPGLVFSITGGVDAALFTIDGSNGTLRFNSAPDFETPGDAGGDNVHDIVVTVTDSGGLTAAQSASVTVTDVNEAPVADAASETTDEDTPLNGQLTASDVDEDDLTFVLATGGEPSNGSVTINESGAYIYTPDDDFNGDDSFTFEVSDGAGGTATATVSLTVTAVNDDPVARDDLLATDERTAIVGSLFANNGNGRDRDVDSDFIITAINGDETSVGSEITLPSGALLTIASDGSISFDPNQSFGPLDDGESAFEQLTYTITDAEGATADANITIRVSGITDTIFGTEEDDLIRGTDLGDDIDGLAGNDLITGLSGDDTIRGGQGVDIIRGGADADLLMGGSGKDRIFGEGGNDSIEGGAGNDRLLGLSGNDTVRGDEGDDLVSGGGGNDLVLGGDGDDRLRGGRDSDTLLAGEGKDRLQGGTGNDRLFGQAGNDNLTGAGGADELFGGNGIDRLFGRRGNDELTGGEGVDRFFFNLGDGSDTITDFEQGVDFIRINKGADVFSDLTISQVGDDALITFGNVRILALDEDADDFTSSDFIL